MCLENLILEVALLTGSLFFEIFNKYSLELSKHLPIISELRLNILPLFHTIYLCEAVFSVLIVKKSKY